MKPSAKQMKRVLFLLAVVLAAAVMLLFNWWQNRPTRCIKVASWNVQTFFDATLEGTEYKQFAKSDTWGRDAYEVRLMRLASCMKKINADVFALQEIENERVLLDLYNFLSGEWNPASSWHYGAFAKEAGGPIGVALISRIPIARMRTHWLDVRQEEDAMPSMRPVVELVLETKQGELTVFLNHWKSKSGGQEATEVWRNWQESVLADQAAGALAEGRAFLAAGDFNRSVEDFCTADEGSVLLRFRRQGGFAGEGVAVASPWLLAGQEATAEGSYFYDEHWERIDNFFLAGSLRLVSFEVAMGEWCDEEGKPRHYELWSGRGYSDHLPIVCCVEL